MLALKLFSYAFSLLWACNGGVPSERVYKTAHFSIFFTELDRTNIKEIADSLESSYPKITSHLGSGDLETVNVYFYEDNVALQKVFPGIPVWAVGQATSVSEIHIVSPNNREQDYHTMIRNIKHEFAHCVSLKINSKIANTPRWLWESVALYEANLPWDPRMLKYMTDQMPPSVAELNDLDNPKIYEVGYFIAQFIDEEYGVDTLHSLIRNNGNLKATLQLEDDEFTKRWFLFVKTKHGL